VIDVRLESQCCELVVALFFCRTDGIFAGVICLFFCADIPPVAFLFIYTNLIPHSTLI
jgi:hypothetical protein